VFVAGLRLGIVGIVIGATASHLSFRLATPFVPRLDPPSSAMLAANALVLLVIAALAAWIPARRAAAVDPIHAMRAESLARCMARPSAPAREPPRVGEVYGRLCASRTTTDRSTSLLNLTF
jgi:predicted lysophospholipase L1 biosynthesis ABC-type transport system permease subunit